MPTTATVTSVCECVFAVVAIVDDTYADRVEAALVNSDKRINKAIDKGDYDELQKAIAQSSGEVSQAVRRGSAPPRRRLPPLSSDADPVPGIGVVDARNRNYKR